MGNTQPKNNSAQLDIVGMDCADCALRIEKSVGKLAGVKLARVDFMNARMKVEFDPSLVEIPDIEKSVKAAGYTVKKEMEARTSTLVVNGMDCADESRPIEKRLRKMSGVSNIRFNLLEGKVSIDHSIPLGDIQIELKELGFDAVPASEIEKEVSPSFLRTHKLTILTGISGTFAIAGIILHHLNFPDAVTTPLLLTAVISGGYHIAIKGWKEARNFSLGMDFLMSMAVIGAMLIGEWSEAAMVIFLFALAQLLESFSVDRARRSIRSLMDLAPPVALVKLPSGESRVPVEEVEVGSTIIIKPGERLPLDGVVAKGYSLVNQAPITGESIPQEKKKGSQVFAGTINRQGILEVVVSHKFKETMLSRIIRIVEEAQARKAPAQQFVEKFARFYTPGVVVFSVLVAAIPPLLFGGIVIEWLYRGLVLLVIACPCALVISTPVTIVSALTNAARNGILIKGGASLEIFNRVCALALDKTGTLTTGQPAVGKITAVGATSPEEVLQIAASLESRSEHPLGKAIVDYARKREIKILPVDEFESQTGLGIKARIESKTYLVGNHRMFDSRGLLTAEINRILDEYEHRKQSLILVGDQQKILGIIAVSDAVRQNARQAMDKLKRSGIRHLIMLTGDNQAAATAIAQETGMEDFRAELMPEDKLNIVQELLKTYRWVAMVGDGINDSPALAAATVGISMGASGTDTALETADIALMNDDLNKLSFLKYLSERSVTIIKQNIFFALFLKSVFFVLALPGLVTLWMAVFADMGASLLVIFNGLRALHIREKDKSQ